MTTNKYLSFIKANVISFLRSGAIVCLCVSVFFIFNINAFNGFALELSTAKCPPAIVKAVLYLGADVHANNDQALNIAVFRGQVETVKILLDHGAGAGSDGYSFLTTALMTGNIGLAKILIERLNIKFKCSKPWTFLAKGWNEESVKFINDQLKGVPYECAPKSKGSEKIENSQGSH